MEMSTRWFHPNVPTLSSPVPVIPGTGTTMNYPQEELGQHRTGQQHMYAGGSIRETVIHENRWTLSMNCLRRWLPQRDDPYCVRKIVKWNETAWVFGECFARRGSILWEWNYFFLILKLDYLTAKFWKINFICQFLTKKLTKFSWFCRELLHTQQREHRCRWTWLLASRHPEVVYARTKLNHVTHTQGSGPCRPSVIWSFN